MAGAREFVADQAEELVVQRAGQFRERLGDVQVALGQHHLHVVQQVAEERPVARHLRQHLFAELLHTLLQRAAEAIPAGQDRAALGPREHPRDRAQVLHAAHAAAAGRARAQGHLLDHVDRRGAAEVVDEAVALDESTITAPAGRRQRVHQLAPMRLARLVFARTQAGAQHRAHGLLQVAQGQCADAVLAVDHLALLGHPQHAGDRAARRGHQRRRDARAATTGRATAAVEEREVDARCMRHVQQLHLGALQAPARGQRAAVLAAVGVAQHHPLLVVARGEVTAVDRIVEQRAQGGRRVLQVVDGFEQRGNIERHMLRFVDQPTAPRQRQHRQHVGGRARHADDVQAGGVLPVALAAVAQGGEHRLQRFGIRVAAVRKRSFASGVGAQPVGTCDAVARRPVRIGEQGRQRVVVHARILSHVEPCQMEAEAAHAAQQAFHRVGAGMHAAMLEQAVGDQLQVVQQFAGGRIAVHRTILGQRQSRTDQLQQAAVRHVGVARADHGRGGGETRAVVRQPRVQRRRHGDPTLGLAELARQRGHVLAVTLQHQRALRVEAVGNGVGAHVRVAVHVAADPAGEAQQSRQLDRHAVGFLQRLRHRFVQCRHDPVQRVGQVEIDVFALVLHAGSHRRGLGGLPAGGQRHVDAVAVLLALLRRALRVEAVDQRAHDRLLLFQQRSAHRLGRVRGEYRLDPQPVEPAHQFIGAHAGGLQSAQHVEQRFRLRRAALALVVAAAADAVHPLGRVHRLEISGERARQRFGVAGVETGQRGGQVVHRGAFAAAADRRGAHLFDPLEERRAALLGQHPPDHRAEPADVLAQRAVGRQELGFAA